MQLSYFVDVIISYKLNNSEKIDYCFACIMKSRKGKKDLCSYVSIQVRCQSCFVPFFIE